MAEILIDGECVVVKKNESDHLRGLHIVVINPEDRKVEFAQVFDTYNNSDGFDAFTSIQFPRGHIIVAACKDDCVTNLSMRGKIWFGHMGSREILRLGYRQGFAFIGIIGKKAANEKRSMDTRDKVSVQYVSICKVENSQKSNRPKNEKSISERLEVILAAKKSNIRKFENALIKKAVKVAVVENQK